MKTTITLFTCWLLYSAGLTFAQPGTLDHTFSADGKAKIIVGQGAFAYSVAIQSDGKIVAAGSFTPKGATQNNFIAIRLNSDGTLDHTFHVTGAVGIDFGGDDYCYGVAIQADGKIVLVGGGGNNNWVVARLNGNGSLDNTFGSGGKVTTIFSPYLDEADAVTIQQDGKIVVVGGTAHSDFYNRDFAIARYNPNGTLDGNFSTDGKDVLPGYFGATSVAIQADGKILVGGPGALVARYDINGTLDPTFWSGGGATKGTAMVSGFDNWCAIALQANGKIVLAGDDQNNFIVARLTANGGIDNTFSGDGKLTTNFNGADGANGVAVQQNGKIVVAGQGGPNSDFALARYTSTGTLDNSFGTGGKVTTNFGGLDLGYAIALQKDGKIVVAGQAIAKGVSGVAVARYNGDPVSLTTAAENISAADKKLPASSTIKIFPNPAKDVLSIGGMDASSTKTISIVDMNGRVVQTTTTGNITHTWHIASLPAGTYYLVIDDKKKKTSLKFVKE